MPDRLRFNYGGQSFEGPGIDEIRRRAMILLGFGLGRSQSRDPRQKLLLGFALADMEKAIEMGTTSGVRALVTRCRSALSGRSCLGR